MTTHAFIDAQNVQQTTKSEGWQVDLHKFRTYLSDKHNVTHAYYFIGHIPKFQRLYTIIQKAGYIIIFKEVAVVRNGEDIKGNIDVNLTLHAADTVDDYEKAVLVSADGDFLPLVHYWQSKDKFKSIISPARVSKTSRLLKRDANGCITYMENLKNKISR